VKAWLLEIRAARARAAPGPLLMLGSSGNHATLEGMAAVVRAWQSRRLARGVAQLRVAGYGSEAVRDRVPSCGTDVAFLGSLSREALGRELETAVACVCHQEDGSGALTRIADLLTAGVPVLASAHAARTYHGAPGLREYDGIEQLDGALAELCANPPAVAVPPEPDLGSLVARVSAPDDGRTAQDEKARMRSPSQ
jgi:hypothetical protein